MMYFVFSQKRARKPIVSTKASVIEINGSRYDANTGKLIGTVIDGFRSRPLASLTNRRPQTKRATKAAKKSPTKSAQTVHRRTEHSSTLMRRIVNRHSPIDKELGTEKISKSKPRTIVSSARLSKAMSIAKNAAVKHFGNPTPARSSAAIHSITSSKKAIKGEVLNAPIQPASTAVALRPTSNMLGSISQQRLERMLDEALVKADAHRQTLSKHLSRKQGIVSHFKTMPAWLIAGLTTLILVCSGVLFAWKNVPQISMKIASLRSEIKGGVPTYIPSGYKFAGPIRQENGNLTMTYRAGGEGKFFKITEQASNWDSTSLEANAVPKNSQVQTSQLKGTTIYIYDQSNNATWVNNGVRYTLQDNA